MLLSFHIENFKSILNVTIPLTYAEKKAPNGYKQMDLYPFIEENDYRTVPILAFYGANASGKSNIVKAFSVFTHIVRTKYYPSDFTPNKLHSNNSPIIFKLNFLKSGNEYSYTLKIDDKEIIYEQLNQGKICIFSIENRKIQFNNLATDAYSFEKLASIFSVECLDLEKQFRTPFLRVVGSNYAGLNSFITEAYIFIVRNIEVYGLNKFPFAFGIEKLAETNDDVSLQNAFNEVVTILRKLDIDITRMELKRNEINNNQKINFRNNHEYVRNPKSKTLTEVEINSYHKDIYGNEVQFDFNEESTGTQRVACLLGIILSVLQRGNILIIDELGNSLHPYLFAEIVRLFKDRRYNKNNSQLIFTTHNTDIMDEDMMRVSELGIVKKTLKKGTEFKRISDFEGVRNVTSFRKQYLEGNFSGIPYPYI
ncbi:MAG: ATP-binding protein [Sphaerochaetaceae bacterium]|nr:ATP-binding protein [Sphaerochaetaceae bacterium]